MIGPGRSRSPRRQATKSLHERRYRNSSTRDRLRIRVRSPEPSKQKRSINSRSPQRKLGPKPAAFRAARSRSPKRWGSPGFRSPGHQHRLHQRGLRTGYFQGQNKELNDSEIASRYQKIMDMYSRGKISQKNAWRLRLVENIDRMISLQAAGNYKKASATIAAATQIYRYRVDDVYKQTCKMMTNIIGGKAVLNIEKKKKAANLKTLAPNSSCTMDARQVLADIDPMFHKTTSAFDEGGSRGLLMNNLCVHNGCDTILDSTTVIMKATGKSKNKASKTLDDVSHEKEDFDSEDRSWLSFLNTKHKPLQFQERDICPIAKQMIKKIEQVKLRPDARKSSRSDHGSKSHDFAMMDFFEEDDPQDYKELTDLNDAEVLGNYDVSTEEPMDEGKSCLVHPSLLKNWTGPEQWMHRQQLFRRRFKQLQKVHEEKKKEKAREPVGNRINFWQAADCETIPEEMFSAPIRPLSTKLTEASLLKLSNDLHIFPEDLQLKKNLLNQLFTKPKLYVTLNGGVKEKEPTPSANLPINEDISMENDFDINDPYDDYALSSPTHINSPTSRFAGDEGLQLMNDRGEIEKVMVEVAKISKKIDIKALKDSIWRHIYRHCLRGTRRQPVERPEQIMADRDVKTYPVATSFRSAMTYISNYYDKVDPRSKDELSVPFVFMALLHLANVKNLRFSPMKDGAFGSNFKIMVDESTKTQ